jgi:hypothetical protein
MCAAWLAQLRLEAQRVCGSNGRNGRESSSLNVKFFTPSFQGISRKKKGWSVS